MIVEIFLTGIYLYALKFEMNKDDGYLDLIYQNTDINKLIQITHINWYSTEAHIQNRTHLMTSLIANKTVATDFSHLIFTELD